LLSLRIAHNKKKPRGFVCELQRNRLVFIFEKSLLAPSQHSASIAINCQNFAADDANDERQEVKKSFNDENQIMSDADYKCLDDGGQTCATNCTSLEACEDCDCVIIQSDVGGPWGEVMDVIFCLFPIIFLVYATIKPKAMSTTVSLPVAALFMFLIRLMYLASDPLLTSGAIILGFHEAVTPLTIMAGAITLFESMEASYCLPYMMREMKDLTNGHPVAELMLYVYI
jgi:hypothetical protein